MTQPELDLLLAVVLIYLYECVFWLGPAETGYTRDGATWRSHAPSLHAFTLLGRRPVLSDPLLLKAGLVRTKEDELHRTHRRALARAAELLDSYTLLVTQCRMQAALLLLGLPVLLYTHRLTPLWREYTVVLLFSHVLLCFLLWRALRVLPKKVRSKLFGPVLLNPLGATRVLDPLAQALYEANR